MVRLLAVTTLALLGNAIGLIVAAVVLDDVRMDGAAFFIAVGIFTLAFVVLRPLIIKLTLQHSSALAGGSALIATFVALAITDLLSDGLSIAGFGTWVLATIIVWLTSVAAAVLLPLVLFKKALGRGRDTRSAGPTTW